MNGQEAKCRFSAICQDAVNLDLSTCDSNLSKPACLSI